MQRGLKVIYKSHFFIYFFLRLNAKRIESCHYSSDEKRMHRCLNAKRIERSWLEEEREERAKESQCKED